MHMGSAPDPGLETPDQATAANMVTRGVSGGRGALVRLQQRAAVPRTRMPNNVLGALPWDVVPQSFTPVDIGSAAGFKRCVQVSGPRSRAAMA